MSSVKIKVSNTVVEELLREILASVRRLEKKRSYFEDATIAAAIRKNTEALSSLSTNPPEVQYKEKPMSTDPGSAVTDALAAQTAAIADLAEELATEHDQWVAAAQSGDTGQAEAIVAEVQANTDKLNALVEELRASDPSAPQTGGGGDQPHPDQTLPGDL